MDHVLKCDPSDKVVRKESMNATLEITTAWTKALLPPAPAPKRGRGMTATAEARADGAAFSAAIGSIAVRRDKAAFAMLFRHFAPRVKGYFLRLGVAGALAEDLAQETLLTVWRKAEQYDAAKAEAATWIFTIARNLRIDHLRRERRPVADDSILDQMPDDSPPADDQLAQGQRAVLVRAALATLPPDQAEVIQLSYFEDRPHSEIAARLNLPLGTVKSRLRLAMGRIRTHLGESAS